MEREEFLASRHREVVDEFIGAVLDEVACDMGQVERNVVGVALRHEIETRLAPELLAVHALLLGAEGETLGRLPEWLDRLQTPLPGDSEFFTRMGRRLDPVGYEVLEENLGLLPGESAVRRMFEGHLWEMVPTLNISG